MPGPFDPTKVTQIGRYVVTRFHAEGGMSWIFEVTDPEFFNARRALKLMKPEAAVGDEGQRFLDEVRTLATLEHPNLVRVYDFGTDEATGYQFYTMEYLEGSDLSGIVVEWLVDSGVTRQPGQTPSLDDICQYFDGILSALALLHRNGIFHRDIKPENIKVSAEGIAKLIDLGIAKNVASAGVTQAGLVPGTPLYMSPEHSMGEEVRAPSDLFSLGLTLYRLLAGRTVYDGIEGLDSTNSNMVLRHLWQWQRDHAELEFQFPSSVPEPIRAVVRQACQLDPALRYPDAESMRQALRKARRTPQEAPRATATGKGLWRAAAIALGVATLGTAVYLGSPLVLTDQARTTAEQARLRAEGASSQVTELRQTLSGVPDRAAREVLSQTETSFERAGFSLREARRDYQDESYLGAARRFDDAERGYGHVCATLVEGYLEAASAAQMQQVGEKSARIPDAARRHLPEQMAELDRDTAALQAEIGSEGCERAAALEARIVSAAALMASIENIYVGLSDRLPSVAQQEIERAATQQQAARAASSTDKRFRAALADGDQQLKEARSKLRRKQYQSATDSAQLAVASFERARSTAFCIERSKTATTLVEEADEAGLPIGGTLRLQVLAAANAYKQKQFGHCATEYQDVVDGLQDLLAAAAPVLESVRAAELARGEARDAGVGEAAIRACIDGVSDCTMRMRAHRFSLAAENCLSAEKLCRDATAEWRTQKARDEQGEVARARAEKEREMAAEQVESQAKSDYAELEQRLEAARDRGLPLVSLESRAAGARKLLDDGAWDEATARLAELVLDLEGLDRDATPALEARASATRERERATQANLEGNRLSDGEAAIERAESRFQAGRFDEARQNFDLAGRKFSAAISDAGERARVEQKIAEEEKRRQKNADEASRSAAATLKRVEKLGIGLGPEIERYHQTALADRQAGRHADAAEGFRVVESELKGLLERAETTIAQRKQSKSARRRLAAKKAPANYFEGPDGLHSRGDTRLADGDLEGAGTSYEDAVAGYEKSAETWAEHQAKRARQRLVADRARKPVDTVLSELRDSEVGLGALQRDHDAARARYGNGRYSDAEQLFKALLPKLEKLRRRARSIIAERKELSAAIERAVSSPVHDQAELAKARKLSAGVASRLSAGQLDSAGADLGAALQAAQAALPSPEDYARQAVQNWNEGWNEENISLLQESRQLTDRQKESIERLFRKAEISQNTTIGGVQRTGADQFEVVLSYARVVDYPDRSPLQSEKSGRALVAHADGHWQISSFKWE